MIHLLIFATSIASGIALYLDGRRVGRRQGYQRGRRDGLEKGYADAMRDGWGRQEAGR